MCRGVAGGVASILKSLILQGFSRQKSRSVTAFRYTQVVHCAGDLTLIISLSPSKPSRCIAIGEYSWLSGEGLRFVLLSTLRKVEVPTSPPFAAPVAE